MRENGKQTVTQGELLTLGLLPMVNDFAGPAMVVDGDADLSYCGPGCFATGGVAETLAVVAAGSFPNVAEADFEPCVQPDAGHGINLHYNTTGAYGDWLDWLGEKGLESL